MNKTEISNNNPEKKVIPQKEVIPDKSISVNKAKEISKQNSTQNKKVASKIESSNKSFD